MTALRDDFAALVAAGERCDLARAALTVARVAYPTLDPAPWLAELDALAGGVRPGPSPAATVDALVTHLFRTAGFKGNEDDYYDPRNSFLNDVLARRTGIPISLAVVVIETGARLGLPIEGVGFPGHFLVRTPGASGPVLRDPFFGGRVVEDAELLERFRALGAHDATAVPAEAVTPAPRPMILARMLRNLVRVYLDRDDYEHALTAVDLTLVLLPDSPEDVRTRGLLYERLECPAAALQDLRRYLDLVPDAPDTDAIRGRVLRLAQGAPTVH